MALIIKGQSGKALNTTSRLLGEDLKVISATFRKETLAAEELTWTARTADIAASETILPDHEQIVELWDGATRVFRGWAAEPAGHSYGARVTVKGPWYWLEKIPLSSAITGAVNTADRTTVVFAQQGVVAMITTLLNRAIALGAPITVGAMDAAWTVTQQQYSGGSFADVLSELVRQIPDAVAWWDHSGTGAPAFRLTRRASMAAVTWTAGTAPLADFEVALFPGRVPSRVEIHYVARQTTFGKPELMVQAAGSAVAGRIQQIPVSGKELVDFLPPDSYESIDIQTASLVPTTAFVLANDATLSGIEKQFGHCDGAVGTSLTTWTGASDDKTAQNWTFPATSYKRANGNDFAPASGRRLVISSDDLPAWVQTAYAAIPVTIQGTWIGQWKDSEQGVGTGWDDAMIALRDASFQKAANAYETPNTSGPTANYRNDWCAFAYEIKAWLVNTSFPSMTTLYRPPDYDYLLPPSGLASNLLAAQQFTPAAGFIELEHEEFDFPNRLTQLHSVAGSLPSLATAAAMARATTWDLVTRTERIDLGGPARFDLGERGPGWKGTAQSSITL